MPYGKGIRMKRITLAVFIFSTYSLSYAAPIKVIGGGAYTCGNHTNDTPTGKFQDVQWVLGYLSAKGLSENVDLMDGLDADAISAALDLYCQKEPLRKVREAAENIYLQLRKRASK